jgi:hypothetical protein
MGRLINTLFGLRALVGAALIGVGGAAQAASLEELNAWQAAQQTGTIEAYQAFLEAFPDGEFAAEAFAALADSFASEAGGDIPQADPEQADVGTGTRDSGGDDNAQY